MNNKSFVVLTLILLAVFNTQLTTAFAQGTAFTYQGRLNSSGAVANGSYDLQFTLYTTNVTGTALAGPVTNTAVAVTNGLFTTLVDFGNVFTGASNWLAIAVSTNAANAFSTLAPRQQLTPVPYAITAANISGTVASASLSGTYGSAVALTNAGNSISGSFTGNGAAVTNVNAAALNGLNATNFWQLGGNNVAAGKFLGSTNNQPVEIWANNGRVLRLEPGPNAGGITPNVIGGASGNFVASGYYSATIGGGGYVGYYTNSVISFYGTVSGGGANTAGFASTVGGGLQNSSLGSYSVISGGDNNSISTLSPYSVIGGGENNVVYTDTNGYGAMVIAGGYANVINSNSIYSVIGGGYQNTIQANAAQGNIGGGSHNSIQANSPGTIIVGGSFNVIQANSPGTIIVGGFGNTNSAINSFVGGGVNNSIASGGNESVIGGGYQNIIGPNATNSTIGGGYQNYIVGNGSFIGGGGFDGTTYLGNVNSGNAAVIVGGLNNFISSGGDYSVIGGGQMNAIQQNASQSMIGGGYSNTIQSLSYGPSYQSVIVGGAQNTIQYGAYQSMIGGGTLNTIQTNAAAAVIGGGYQNTIQISAYESMIGGGFTNTIQGGAYESTIGGGDNNVISAGAFYSTIGGGVNNVVSGAGGTVPGGNGNAASGANSFAAGTFAQTTNDGTFVWADLHYTAFDSTGPNQFLIRASGGVGINTNNPAGAALSVNGSITAPMWKATNVVNSAGPLTLTKSFTTSGGTLVIAASGTGYSTTAGVTIGMDIKLDGTTIDSCLIYTNPSATHMAFLPKTIVKTGVAAGSHTLALVAHGSTSTDATDNFCVTVQELPF